MTEAELGQRGTHAQRDAGHHLLTGQRLDPPLHGRVVAVRVERRRVLDDEPFGAREVLRGHGVSNRAIRIAGRLEPRARLPMHRAHSGRVGAFELGLQDLPEQPVHPVGSAATVEWNQEQAVPVDAVQQLTCVVAVQHLVADRTRQPVERAHSEEEGAFVLGQAPQPLGLEVVRHAGLATAQLQRALMVGLPVGKCGEPGESHSDRPALRLDGNSVSVILQGIHTHPGEDERDVPRLERKVVHTDLHEVSAGP
ncbi:MAG: hypothetical protein M5U14_20930 [Acidimicrobiia bacterium]|nr:hypothetical protein [Acidimicrobiia bacterium]